MSGYLETEVAGTTYIRCKEITIYNPINKTPIVAYKEEKVVALGDQQVLTVPVPSSLNKTYDPTQSIDIIDPETLLPTGNTIMMAEIYVLLFSAYLAAAKERDNSGQVVI